MNFLENNDLGKLILRFGVGFLMLFHGYAKITHGVGFIESSLVNAGFPAFIAYGIYIGEIVAPMFLILGIKVRLSALIITFSMLSAIFLAHANDIFTLTPHGAWSVELPMFYIFSSLAIVFFGAGKYSINKNLA